MKKKLREQLCKPFCAYFKPVHKEDAACEGYVVIERLLRNKKAFPRIRPDDIHNGNVQEILRQTICPVCAFYPDDCDFILYAFSLPLGQQSSTPPCGGFLLLAHLLQSDVIKIDDIRNII